MDLLSDQPEVQVDGIYLKAPEGDDSDGYDDSDTEEGQADFLSRNLLKVSFKNLNKFFFVLCIFIYKLPTYFFYFFLQTTVAEVVILGIEQLNLEGYDDMEAVDIMDMDEDKEEEEEAPAKKAREAWDWEDKPRAFRSKPQSVFPEPNYTRFKNMSPSTIFNLMLSEDIYMVMATKSNQYAMEKFGLEPNIKAEDLKAFFGILLMSGYNQMTDYRMYWSKLLVLLHTVHNFTPYNNVVWLIC